jgi:hypothetical protein
MYKGVKSRKREKWQDVKLPQSKCEDLSMSIMVRLGIIYMSKTDGLQ